MTSVNDPPSGEVTISGVPFQYQTLTASNTLTDVEGISGDILYTWSNSKTGETIELDEFDVGNTITVTASYTDGQDIQESKTSEATDEVKAVTYTITQPSNGTATIVGQDVTYTPNNNFHGTDTFEYTASVDGQSSTATVTVEVQPVNDAPTGQNQSELTATVGEEIQITLTGTDIDSDDNTLTYTIVSQPENGTYTQNGNVVNYTAGTTAGTDSFTYKVNDGTADSEEYTVTIVAVPSPVELSGNEITTATYTIEPSMFLRVTANAKGGDGASVNSEYKFSRLLFLFRCHSNKQATEWILYHCNRDGRREDI